MLLQIKKIEAWVREKPIPSMYLVCIWYLYRMSFFSVANEIWNVLVYYYDIMFYLFIWVFWLLKSNTNLNF